MTDLAAQDTMHTFQAAMQYVNGPADADSKQFLISVLASIVHPDLVCALAMLDHVAVDARRHCIAAISAHALAPLTLPQKQDLLSRIMPALMRFR